MTEHEPLLRRAYDAFNARDVDGALTLMHADVDWPNALEGRREHGQTAVRDYWARQFRLIDSRVDPERFETDAAGRAVVDVHQIVHDLAGDLISDRRVRHVFTIRDGLIERMDILEGRYVETARSSPPLPSYSPDMAECRDCGGRTSIRYRYCPWCAAPQRRKLVEFFVGADQDARRAIRVSRYLPERRVRFSVWDESGTARAAVSLDEDEASRLAAFVAPPRPPRSRLVDDLRALVRR